MHPLLKIWGIEIHTYGLALALAFIVVTSLSVLEARREGIPPLLVIDAFLWVLIGAIIGSKLAFLVHIPQRLLEAPFLLFQFWRGGYSSLGGLLGGCITLFLYLKWKGYSFLHFTDIIAPFIAVGFAIQKLFGCLMAGCCYGKPTSLPFHLTFSNPRSLVPVELLKIPLHPVQIYDAFAGITVFLILLRLKFLLKHYGNGTISALFLLLFSSARFITSFFRGDLTPLFYSLNISGVEYGFLSILSCILCAYILRRKK